MSNLYCQSKSELIQIRTKQNIYEDEQEIRDYCFKRLEQEKELKKFKEKQKEQIDGIHQELSEEGISPRRIHDAIRYYKSIECVPENNIDNIFKILKIDIERPIYLSIYEDNEELIKKSIEILVNKKNELKKFKNQQSFELKPYVESVQCCRTPMYIIKGKYNELKSSLKLFTIEARSNIKTFRSEEMINFINSIDNIMACIFNDYIKNIPQIKESQINSDLNDKKVLQRTQEFTPIQSTEQTELTKKEIKKKNQETYINAIKDFFGDVDIDNIELNKKDRKEVELNEDSKDILNSVMNIQEIIKKRPD